MGHRERQGPPMSILWQDKFMRQLVSGLYHYHHYLFHASQVLQVFVQPQPPLEKALFYGLMLKKLRKRLQDALWCIPVMESDPQALTL